MTRVMNDPKQEELPLKGALSHEAFPGRVTLRIEEVLGAFSMSREQVYDLIVCGDLEAICISATRERPAMTKEERKRVPRSHWRVTVNGYDAFLRARNNRALEPRNPTPTT